MRPVLPSPSRRSPRILDYLESPIALDIKKGKAKDVLLALLDENVNVQDQESGDTALHISTAYHKKKITDKLLNVKCLDINITNKNGQTPLHVAILNRNSHAISKLLKRHDELNPAIADASGNNILHYAAMKSLTSYEINKILTKLRKSHGDLSDLVRRQNSIGNTPLHQAVEHGSLDTAKLFISYDEELLKCRNNAGESPLDISLRVGKDSQTAMLLSQSSPDLYPDNILSRIVESNMHALLESLFQATSDSSMAKGTASVLGYSLTLPSLEAIRIRISRYNDISPETGISLVHDSIIERKREILSVFLGRSDVDLTLADKEGNTALHLSLLPKNYSPDIVCSLINWFALKKKLSDGTARQTAKQLKLVGDHIPLFSIFVSAILNKQNREGETPLLMLFQCTSTMGEKMTLHCIEQFIQFGADVTAFDSKGNTALFYAVYQGNTKAAVLLRIAGASTAVENNDGLTPIDLALEREDEEMTCILTAEPDALKGGGKSKKRP